MITFMKSMRPILIIVLYVFFADSKLFSQDLKNYDLQEVVVTAGRIPIHFTDLSRKVVVLSKRDINELPVYSVPDLLQYVGGIDLKQRGVNGTQTDIAVRGGTFEQTLIMIDGIKISDPQTAHHNLNLPLSIDQIERIEILKGQGSKSFGPNAFSGAINFITKKTRETSFGMHLSAGTFHSFNTSVNGSYNIDDFTSRLSVSRKKSDGYILNTNYDLVDISYNGSLSLPVGVVNLFYGYGNHKFGANSFYTTRFPNQWESVKTNIAALSATFGGQNFIISPKLYWRKKNDEFLLDHTNPSFYKNLHETNSYGAELQVTYNSHMGKTSAGIEFYKDEIVSSSLGNRKRDNKGVFIEHNISPLDNLFISGGGFLYNYAEIGWKFWPGLDISYLIFKGLKLKSSVGKSFRIPSYTELFYSDPVTEGNAELESEETLNYEFGVEYKQALIRSDLTIFRNEGKNIIDWIRTGNENPWQARNISTINTNGLEFSLDLLLKDLIKNITLEKISLNYTYLDSDKGAEIYDSRYVLDHLKHQLIIGIYHNYFDFIKQSWHIRYEDRANFEKHTVVDTRLSKEFNNGELYLSISNLFNKTHHDISGVILPGRWINAGFKLNFSNL